MLLDVEKLFLTSCPIPPPLLEEAVAVVGYTCCCVDNSFPGSFHKVRNAAED